MFLGVVFIATLIWFISTSLKKKNNSDKFYRRNPCMQVADEKLIINESGRSGLGLSNFMQTKHAHEHFDLKLVISPHVRLEYLHIFFLSSLRSWKY